MIAYGSFCLKPREYEDLQPHEFQKMLTAYNNRHNEKIMTAAYFVSCLMNMEGKIAKSTIKAQDIARPFLHETQTDRKADREYLENVFHDLLEKEGFYGNNRRPASKNRR